MPWFIVKTGVLSSLLALFSFSLPGLAAEEGTIATDRPGISFSSHTVSPGNFYLESGLQYSINRTGLDVENYNLPQLALRTGITDKFEIQLFWAGWNRDTIEGFPHQHSQSDITLGGKYRLFQSSSTNLTLLGQLSVPTGSASVTSDSFDPSIGLLFDKSLGNNFSLFANIVSDRFEELNKKAWEHRVTAGLGYNLNSQWASFIEYYSAFPDIDSVEESTLIDGGFTFYPGPDMQLDFSVGIGLRDTTSDFAAIGFSIRY